MSDRISCEFDFRLNEENLSRLLAWANRYDHFQFLTDNNFTECPYGGFPNILAMGCKKQLSLGTDSFHSLHKFHKDNGDFLFGYFSYDIKNQIHRLKSGNPDHFPMPGLFFFIPEIIVEIGAEKIKIHSHTDPEVFYRNIADFPAPDNRSETVSLNVGGEQRNQYLKNATDIIRRIEEGDFYEINYCLEFVQNARIEPFR
jgi:para-aminobenzoate synthetase component 1